MDTTRIDQSFNKLRETESAKWEEFRKQQEKEFAEFVANFAKS